MMVLTNGKIIIDDEIVTGKNVYIQNGVICDISNAPVNADDTVIDVQGNYISPGFIDMHTHGASGCCYAESDEEGIYKAAKFQLLHGATSVLPTIGATTIPNTLSALEHLKNCYNKEFVENNIVGIHLEGPYFAKEMCGAQNTDFITAPIKEDYENITQKYGEYVKIWSYAPENDINAEFCKYISSKGIIAIAGHTAAKYDDMLLAMENGCKGITHLYSCTSTITREGGFRKLGVIETAFLHDELYAEIIADGKHLPPELIKLIYKIKGSDKICLVTDSLAVAGTENSTGVMSGTRYIIEDDVCKLYDRSAFAGSIATADRCVRVCTKEADIPLAEAVKMMTKIPAEILKLNKGQIKAGFDADIVVFDDNVNIKKVILGGNLVS